MASTHWQHGVFDWRVVLDHASIYHIHGYRWLAHCISCCWSHQRCSWYTSSPICPGSSFSECW
uniref:Uncharacterized protein n=1 Tax=Arundo donax TaxID=35708 RepID=A0A0A8ZB96_ARUDO